MVNKIVVWDPSGEIPEGQVLSGDKQVPLVEARGVVMLLVDPDLARAPRLAVGGYFRRGWGVGWLFDGMVGQRGCPMLLWAQADRPYLHWAARLVPHKGEPPRGVLRLTTDSGQPAALSGGLRADGTALELSELGEQDQHGGWTVRGRSVLNCTSDGHLGLSLYAAANGCLVRWSAVTQTAQP